MNVFNLLSKIILTILTIAVFFFLVLFVYFAKKNLFSSDTSEEIPSYLKMEPLSYESIGNYPQIDETATSTNQDHEFTLELGTCEDKTCIEKTLENLYKSGVDAFYTPTESEGKMIYRIRRGIFNSRQLAEKAQAALIKSKKINSKVMEL